MKSTLVSLCLLAPLRTLLAAGSKNHPIVGVIDLLKNLKEQVISEGQVEEVTYAKFEKWCSDSTRSLEKAVATGKETIEVLKDQVESLTKEEATLTEQIAELTKELAEHDRLGQEATKAHQDATALYQQADADLATTISAFTSAITELQNAQSQTSALLQAKALRGAVAHLTAPEAGGLSELQVQRLSEAVSRLSGEPAEKEVPDFLAKGDYGAHVKKYNFKSDNVIDLLKELKMTFEDQRVEGTKMQTAAENSYNLAKSARDAAIAAATSAKGSKETALGECQSNLALQKGTLENAEADLVADEETLSKTSQDCRMKKGEWQERSKTRELEIEAIKKGIEILGKATGVRTEAPSNPVLPVSPVAASFLQSDPKTRVLNALRQEAARVHSKSFTRFTEQLAARMGGPFDEINDMIQKMIFRLMAEQKDEDEHKSWCDTELSKTNTAIEDKTGKITKLDLEIQADQASAQELGTEIAEASSKAAEIASFIEEATELRNAGKEENEAAIHDAKRAQDAIAKAIAVLEAFYKESGKISDFLQRNSAPVNLPASPSTWDAGYTGVADPSAQPDGIIAVLEKISADFSKMEADTKAQEATDQKNYQDANKEAEIEKARREKEAEMKTQEKSRLLARVATLEKSKKHTTGELDAQKQYLKDLNPACVEGDSTYEDRKAARTAEIAALKDAQVILSEAATAKLVQINAVAF